MERGRAVPPGPAERHRPDPGASPGSTLHDKAFDRGLITFDTELRLVCAPSLRDHFAEATVSQSFQGYEGRALAVPAEAAGPKADYLEWHRREVFGR